MKPPLKAALLSALIFPGLGHLLVLRRPARGCLFLLPAALALAWLLGHLLRLVDTLADQVASGALAFDPIVIAQRVEASDLSGGAGTAAMLVALLCWGGSVADSFWAAPAAK